MLIGFQSQETIKNQTRIFPGSTVLIPKGTLIHSCHPSKKSYISKKDIKVKVHHLMPGQNIPTNDNQYREELKKYEEQAGSVCLLGLHNNKILPRGINSSIPLHNPSVRWVGSSGYWCEADINSVILCE